MRISGVSALLLIGASACGAPSATNEQILEIVATDYTFEAPDTVSAGPTALRLTNVGNVPHEVIVMKLHPGAAAADVFAAQQRGEVVRPSIDGGTAVLFARPGATGDGRLMVDLEAGRDYLLWCNFQDGEETPQHAMMGMFKQIHVRGSADRGSRGMTRHAVVDAGDYFFRVADTLAAGETDFTIANSGLQRHEVSFGRLKAGATTRFFFDEYLKGHDVDSLYDDDGAVLTAYGGDQNEFAVRIDLIAGRSYVLLCEFSDTPEAPRHTSMGMFAGIVVN